MPVYHLKHVWDSPLPTLCDLARALGFISSISNRGNEDILPVSVGLTHLLVYESIGQT